MASPIFRKLFLAATVAGSAVGGHAASAATDTMLYDFPDESKGYVPVGGLVAGPDGEFYGITYSGGKGKSGSGVLFRTNRKGRYQVVADFSKLGRTGCVDSAGTHSPPVSFDSAGNMYGVGTARRVEDDALFKITPAGACSIVTVIPRKEGLSRSGPLAIDAAGNIYGTTYYGGTKRRGTVFKVSPDGTQTILHSFGESSDGKYAISGVIFDSNGNLIGNTLFGGTNNNGIVFSVAPDGTEKILYNFGLAPDGAEPFGSLSLDAAGNIYGVTYEGGQAKKNGVAGTVFRLTPSGTETVLMSFQSKLGLPVYGSVMPDGKGNLFVVGGTTGMAPYGVVDKIAADGHASAFYTFTGAANGSNPLGYIALDSKGSLYGATQLGGPTQGLIFKLTK